jgi:hypothetical protein
VKRFILFICLVLAAAGGTLLPAPGPAEAAEESWKMEFDKVCGQTDSAADMSIAELKKALARCDALKPQIESLEATPRKVYLKRLQMCRNLFAYLLEGKERAQP